MVAAASIAMSARLDRTNTSGDGPSCLPGAGCVWLTTGFKVCGGWAGTRLSALPRSCVGWMPGARLSGLRTSCAGGEDVPARLDVWTPASRIGEADAAGTATAGSGWR